MVCISGVHGQAQAWLQHSSGENQGRVPQFECSSCVKMRGPQTRLLTQLLQESQPTETSGKVWSKGRTALLEEDQVSKHLHELDKHRSVGPKEYTHKC